MSNDVIELKTNFTTAQIHLYLSSLHSLIVPVRRAYLLWDYEILGIIEHDGFQTRLIRRVRDLSLSRTAGHVCFGQVVTTPVGWRKLSTSSGRDNEPGLRPS